MEELEEITRRNLVEAKLTEMELIDDFSQATDELRETLSHISKHSKQTTSQRVSDWFNEVNEPDSVLRQPQTNAVEFNNVLGPFNPAVIPDSTNLVQLSQATVPVRSSADVIWVETQPHSPNRSFVCFYLSEAKQSPPSLAAVNPLSFSQPPPDNTTTKTVFSVTVPVATISAMVGVFRWLKYEHDLSSAALLGQTVQKLPPNMKEAWSLHTVKKNSTRLTLLDFNDWLEDKAEAHERMKVSSGKPKADESVSTVTRTKSGTKVFAATSSSAPSTGTITKTTRVQLACITCKDNHHL